MRGRTFECDLKLARLDFQSCDDQKSTKREELDEGDDRELQETKSKREQSSYMIGIHQKDNNIDADREKRRRERTYYVWFGV
jgi:hypothetical protein